ncbi:Alpha/Beta hydrolase protein [Lineolata rhizophorae]|uniref:Alpha/Beta hydrolase protein n=1 Tax=Lineolata rhizophorae TaxID=578093 RepID=A0A6A6NL63_9PEZI|nr:Alpha/Beta hydrolase protein [Lineolata rhizophorae]
MTPSIDSTTSATSSSNHGSSSRASKASTAIAFAHQAERLGQYTSSQEPAASAGASTQAVEAKFITPQDPVIETASGGRLPAVPLAEAQKLNALKDDIEGCRDPSVHGPKHANVVRQAKDGTLHGVSPESAESSHQSTEPGAPLRLAVPPSRTNPLFPPLPMYGPPTLLRTLQCWSFRASSAVLSLCFLLVIMLGAIFTSIGPAIGNAWLRVTFRDPRKLRPFYEEEERRRRERRREEREWNRKKGKAAGQQRGKGKRKVKSEAVSSDEDEFVPTEGGPDKLLCDVGYYARRVGLDCESYSVQTEDGFIIDLWHIYDPRRERPAPKDKRRERSPEVFIEHDDAEGRRNSTRAQRSGGGSASKAKRKYPVLLIHGLLQSAGAYCTNDDDSLAFYLAKAGYDVWLGNNRCGFRPRHSLLSYNDPRMWAWNIRQMGVLDLPALVSRVLAETGFPKLALVAHSQGTTQTLVALAKEQRPDLGEKISVFCALAPAAYAGPLIGKMYFKFMRVISPGMFRALFGIHAFIPFMMRMHGTLPAKFYGEMGYRIFSFLFNWTDDRWERDLRARMFRFAPVYVSAESMRWWLGRECFAKQKCILATRQEARIEDAEDREEDRGAAGASDREERYFDEGETHPSEGTPTRTLQPPANGDVTGEGSGGGGNGNGGGKADDDRGRFAWYDARAPPMAFWVCGADGLVDGRRLLRRFERGREPFVDVVHAKIIEGYEHLDVLWAVDAVDKVGREIKEVVWRTAPEEVRGSVRVPKGCEEVDMGRGMGGGKGEVRVGLDTGAGEWREEVKRTSEVSGESKQ